MSEVVRADAPGTTDLKLIDAALGEIHRALECFQPYVGERKIATFGSARTMPSDPVYVLARDFSRAAVEAGLQVNGVVTHSGPDWLEVTGGGAPGGGKVITHMDHRIAMAFLVMGLTSRIHVAIDDGSFIATSFPGFVGLMNGMGARIAALPPK